MTMTSCSSTPIISPSNGTLTTYIITKLSLSIYGTSSLTLNEDVNAKTTVNIIKTALTKIDSSCPRSAPTYSSISST